MSEDFKPHLFVKNVHSSQEYITPPGPPIKTILPQRDRKIHGDFLFSSLNQIWDIHNQEVYQRTKNGLPVKDGEYITFISAEKQLLELSSLSSDGAKLLNVKNVQDDKQQIATVYIPDNKKEKLIGKIQKYINDDTKKGVPVSQKLVEKIDKIQRTNIEFIWTGSNEYLPKDESVWCELWLAIEESERKNKLKILSGICDFYNIQFSEELTIFP